MGVWYRSRYAVLGPHELCRFVTSVLSALNFSIQTVTDKHGPGRCIPLPRFSFYAISARECQLTCASRNPSPIPASGRLQTSLQTTNRRFRCSTSARSCSALPSPASGGCCADRPGCCPHNGLVQQRPRQRQFGPAPCFLCLRCASQLALPESPYDTPCWKHPRRLIILVRRGVLLLKKKLMVSALVGEWGKGRHPRISQESGWGCD